MTLVAHEAVVALTWCRARILWNVPVEGKCDPTDILEAPEGEIDQTIQDKVDFYKKTRGCKWAGKPYEKDRLEIKRIPPPPLPSK